MHYPAEWEHNFTPLKEDDVIACICCGQLVLTDAAHTKEVWNEKDKVTLHYCSNYCLQMDYLKRLNERGQ